MVIIQTTSLIYDRSAGKLAVAGGTSIFRARLRVPLEFQTFIRCVRAKRKRPGNRDAPKFQPVRASGSDLGRFDLQKLTGTRDWDWN